MAKSKKKPKSLQSQLYALVLAELKEGIHPNDVGDYFTYHDGFKDLITKISSSIPPPSTKNYKLYFSKEDKDKVLEELDDWCLSVASKNSIKKALK